MEAPLTLKSKFVDWTKGLSISALFLLIAVYLMEHFGEVEEELDGFNIFLAIPVVTFCMWLFLLPSYLTYHKWRKWAEERGWEEGEILK